MRTEIDLQAARSRLDEREAELQQLRRSLEEEAPDPFTGTPATDLPSADQHPGDVGTEAFERTKDVSIRASIERRLTDVQDALARLDGDRYGICQSCGEPIDPERLSARPEVRFCLDDQERAERGA